MVFGESHRQQGDQHGLPVDPEAAFSERQANLVATALSILGVAGAYNDGIEWATFDLGDDPDPMAEDTDGSDVLLLMLSNTESTDENPIPPLIRIIVNTLYVSEYGSQYYVQDMQFGRTSFCRYSVNARTNLGGNYDPYWQMDSKDISSVPDTASRRACKFTVSESGNLILDHISKNSRTLPPVLIANRLVSTPLGDAQDIGDREYILDEAEHILAILSSVKPSYVSQER